MNSNLEAIFSSVTDTLRGGVTTDLMTVIMALVALFLIVAAFLSIKEVLLNVSADSLEGKERSSHGVSREFQEDEDTDGSI